MQEEAGELAGHRHYLQSSQSHAVPGTDTDTFYPTFPLRRGSLMFLPKIIIPSRPLSYLALRGVFQLLICLMFILLLSDFSVNCSMLAAVLLLVSQVLEKRLWTLMSITAVHLLRSYSNATALTEKSFVLSAHQVVLSAH